MIKSFVDIYGQELSYRSPVNAAGKPMVLMVAGATANVDERASPCAGCGNQNVIDYAINTYGMGVKTTGVAQSSGNGNQGSDPLDREYRNWPNVFKLNWPSRPWLASTASTNSYIVSAATNRVGSIGLYSTSLDKHISQLHFPSNIFAQANDGGEEARRLFNQYAGGGTDDTPERLVHLSQLAG